MKFHLSRLSILIFIPFTLLAEHAQETPVRIYRPTTVKIEPLGKQTFEIQAEGTRVEVDGTIKSGQSKGGNLLFTARPEKCEVHFEGNVSNSRVSGLVSLESRSIPLQVHARNLHGKTDTISKTLLGGTISVYGVVQEIDYEGLLHISKAEAKLSGSLKEGIRAKITITGSSTGQAEARGTTESWVKTSHRSVRQKGKFNINQSTFTDSFDIQIQCVNSKLQTTIPISYPQVDVKAKVDLARTSLNPMFEIGRKFPNMSASIRENLLSKYEPVINEKLNKKLRELAAEKNANYFELKKELILKMLESKWLDQARQACRCGVKGMLEKIKPSGPK